MIENVSCTLPISVEQPPPYTDLPVPPYAEKHSSPPPPYTAPLTPLPQNHGQPTPNYPRIFLSLREELDEAILQPILQLDSRQILQGLALSETILAVLVFVFSFIITQSYDRSYYFCSSANLDGYYGIFLVVFNIVLTSSCAFVSVGFPCSCKTPLLFHQTNPTNLIGRFYLLLLLTSIFLNGPLITLLAEREMSFARISLIIVAVLNSKFIIIFHLSTVGFPILVASNSVSVAIILFKNPFESTIMNNVKVAPEVVPATVVDNARSGHTVLRSTETDTSDLMVLYSTQTDTANIIQPR